MTTRAEHQKRREILAGLFERMRAMTLKGFWQCQNCGALDDFNFGEQGQPNNCNSCGSVQLKFIEPSNQKQKAAPSAPPAQT